MGDAADVAQYNESSDLNTHLIAMKADELSEIEHALVKFQENEYGVCELTNKSIPIARLEAMPLTRFSVQAQRDAEETPVF
ncbi:MAG: TraR/DksA C4-type zinc finger protein [Planctomycetaceae bacterium]|nr:TraR/DksA C4-type zinc finger protein [Planctomycetaceae bacterium]